MTDYNLAVSTTESYSLYPAVESYQDPAAVSHEEMDTQTPAVSAKEFREDFVETNKKIERALAVTAIVLSVVALIVLIALAVHGASNCQYETYQAFCNCCERVHDMTRCLTPGMETLAVMSGTATILPVLAGILSSIWLGVTFCEGQTKESMEEWFAEMSNKRSLKAIYEQFYNRCSPGADAGIAPAVKEGVLFVEEAEKLSSLIGQYRELSDKECGAAKWLESQWTEFLDENNYVVREATVPETAVPDTAVSEPTGSEPTVSEITGSEPTVSDTTPSAPPLEVVAPGQNAVDLMSFSDSDSDAN